MKKVFAIFAIAGLIATASCGGKTEETSAADSTRTADSLANVAKVEAEAAKAKEDSAANAQKDTTAAAPAATSAQ
jgi:hypothetical protein